MNWSEWHTHVVDEQFAIGVAIGGMHGKLGSVRTALGGGEFLREGSNGVAHVRQGVAESVDSREGAVRQSPGQSAIDLRCTQAAAMQHAQNQHQAKRPELRFHPHHHRLTATNAAACSALLFWRNKSPAI